MRTKRTAWTALAAALAVATTALVAAPSGAASSWSPSGAGIRPPVLASRASGTLSPHTTPNTCVSGQCEFFASMLVSGATSKGITALFNQPRPKVAPGEESVAMLAIGTVNTQQAILYGWMVSKSVFHDTLPHFVTNAVVNGTPRCLNACGFVRVTKKPPTITPGKLGKFTIKLSKARWLVVYNGTTIGYYPTSLWPGNQLARNALGEAFGSVWSPSATKPRSDMGNGKLGTTRAPRRSSASRCSMSRAAPPTATWRSTRRRSTTSASPSPACHKACSMNYGGPGF